MFTDRASYPDASGAQRNEVLEAPEENRPILQPAFPHAKGTAIKTIDGPTQWDDPSSVNPKRPDLLSSACVVPLLTCAGLEVGPPRESNARLLLKTAFLGKMTAPSYLSLPLCGSGKGPAETAFFKESKEFFLKSLSDKF